MREILRDDDPSQAGEVICADVLCQRGVERSLVQNAGLLISAHEHRLEPVKPNIDAFGMAERMNTPRSPYCVRCASSTSMITFARSVICGSISSNLCTRVRTTPR